jgi:hypothetical protein
MIASLKSERLKPNEGSKPEFHLRWIRELVTRISSALDFLTTSRLIVTDRPDLDSFRFGDSGNNPDGHRADQYWEEVHEVIFALGIDSGCVGSLWGAGRRPWLSHFLVHQLLEVAQRSNGTLIVKRQHLHHHNDADMSLGALDAIANYSLTARFHALQDLRKGGPNARASSSSGSRTNRKLPASRPPLNSELEENSRYP